MTTRDGGRRILDVRTADDPIFAGTGGLVAYYANSFVCAPEAPHHAIAWSEHEGDAFVAGVRRANTWGVQFHPEKSSHAGRRLLANFVALAKEAR